MEHEHAGGPAAVTGPFRPGQPAAVVNRQLRAALDAVARAERSAVIWFAEIHRRRLYRELGYSSIQAYATDALGFSRSRMYRFLRLAEDLDRLPRLKSAVAAGEIGWTKAIQVAKVASTRTEQRWLDEARRSGRRTLSLKVAATRERQLRERERRRKAAARNRAKASGQTTLIDVPAAAATPATPATAAVSSASKTAITLRLDPLHLARFDLLVEKIRKSRILPRDASREELVLTALETLLDSGAPIAADAAAGLAPTEKSPRRDSASPYQIVLYKCDTCNEVAIRANAGTRAIDEAAAAAATCDARIQNTARPEQPNRQTIPPSTRRAVLARDRHRCRAPGCERTRFLEVHHVIPREAGGSNRPENLVTLCSACHRLIHDNPGGDRKGTSRLDWALTCTDGGIDGPPPP